MAQTSLTVHTVYPAMLSTFSCTVLNINIAWNVVLNQPCLPIWPKVWPKTNAGTSSNSPLIHKFLASGLRGKPNDFSNFAAIESASPDLPQQQIDQIRTKMKSYWKEVVKPVLSLDFSWYDASIFMNVIWNENQPKYLVHSTYSTWWRTYKLGDYFRDFFLLINIITIAKDLRATLS